MRPRSLLFGKREFIRNRVSEVDIGGRFQGRFIIPEIVAEGRRQQIEVGLNQSCRDAGIEKRLRDARNREVRADQTRPYFGTEARKQDSQQNRAFQCVVWKVAP
jgi:hypothetical protein